MLEFSPFCVCVYVYSCKNKTKHKMWGLPQMLKHPAISELGKNGFRTFGFAIASVKHYHVYHRGFLKIAFPFTSQQLFLSLKQQQGMHHEQLYPHEIEFRTLSINIQEALLLKSFKQNKVFFVNGYPEHWEEIPCLLFQSIANLNKRVQNPINQKQTKKKHQLTLTCQAFQMLLVQ